MLLVVFKVFVVEKVTGFSNWFKVSYIGLVLLVFHFLGFAKEFCKKFGEFPTF